MTRGHRQVLPRSWRDGVPSGAGPALSGRRPPARWAPTAGRATASRWAPAAGWAALAAAAAAALWLAAGGPGSAPPALAEPDRDDIREAEQELREIEARHQRAVEEYLQAETRLAELDEEIAAAEARLEELAARADASADAAEQVVRRLYTGRSAASAASLLETDDVAEAARRATYLELTERRHRAALEDYRSTRAELDHEAESLETARAEAAELREELAARAERIDAEMAAHRDELAVLRQQVAERERAERERRARAQAEQQAREAAARREAELASAEPTDAAPDAGEPADAAPEAPSDAPPSEQAEVAVEAALSQRGKPYQWGADGPDRYDCSGLSMWAWRQAGVDIPRTSRQQYAALPKVSRSELRPGDLLFFGDPIHHLGIYIGDEQMVEAPYTGETVRVNDIHRDDFAGAARPGG